MEITIDDGTGQGFSAKVDKAKRLHVDSVQRTQSQNAILHGLGFNLFSGAITLTSANESAIAYIKNNGEFPLVLKEAIFIVGATTGGTGDGVGKIFRNPTGGTIISNAVPYEGISNRLFSSSLEITGDIYKGVEGDTITGGTVFANTTRSSFGTVITFDADIIVLGKGNTIAFSWTPPSGNTSQTVRLAVNAFIESADVNGI